MNKLTVLEVPGGGIDELISERLEQILDNGDFTPMSVSSVSSMGSGLEPDLLVVSGRAGRQGVTLPVDGSCDILLIPGTSTTPLGLRAKRIVSYGMSGKDSVTLSSIGERRSMLSLRRELPTLTGGVLERQELPVRHSPRAAPEDTIASAAVLLMLGVPPEKLL